VAAAVEERVTAPPQGRHLAALSVAVVAGALVAVQQRINGGLKEALGDAVLTAAVSFGTGLVLCVAVVAARRRSRQVLPVLRTLPRWWLLGGLGGASLVAVGAAAAPEIGVALLTVGMVGGQTLGGLLVDGIGLGPGGQRPLTPWRAAGAALCLLAIVLSVLGETVHPRPLLLVLVVLAGLLIAGQQALNGRVRHATGDAAVATLVNFVVGATALLTGLLVRDLLGGVHVDRWPPQWWLYVGGPIGAAFVAAAAVIVRPLGVLRLGLAVTAGQLLGAVVLDVTVPERGHAVAAATVIGALLTFVAVGVSGRGQR
jgi:transporter family-2 protein